MRFASYRTTAGGRYAREAVTDSTNMLSAPGRVTIAGHLSRHLPPGTWRSILKQAGIPPKDDQ